MTRQQYLEIIKNKIKKYNVLSVYIFGSYAKGTDQENSDIDLLMILDDDQQTEQVVNALSIELFPREYPIDILAYTRNQIKSKLKWNTFFQSIKKEGILIYGQDVIRVD
ncbi:MAG: hypothetical protein DKM50_04700 [Candidatus Margulisiibacteriota bacterium]|nr:MAG: hypothetical protein A2X43_05830 [Candidatus Margulisbacteria bacterium GWD2_39_127]PZM82048.1 MAG: hypothetical protein DKM50_04700 [Candidatus Margulisiibacteriota bacterium]HCT84087.1 hypothetical protein [Candidatus Margulisiibacteriota bacterium]